ncbi:cystatin domain-containing protein [Photobacterium aquimaris]|uniref:Cystatin n=1 Tax=Photobacterium aquimaris TaxID=512643 RepID=A0A1B8HYE8_9GAMM|nr:cystatin domain-containing protein [Photobacterium aquimaris]MCP4954410.1 cystatin [Photobacterium aquimaris]OBU20226.1 cystatin [Photobacterium aquimaris]PQJ41314.1 cystatin [Photobacterium aquimaris]PSU04641.1 cystatin [Photobacterium aquimaris]SMY15764.1 Cystatin domain protein [Photobacterium aquimaris]
MNKKLLVVALGSLALVACSAQDVKTTQEASMQTGCDYTQAIPGGWQQGEITPEVTAAAQAAVKEIAGDHQLKNVLHVTQQVVAGMNYNVTFSIENNDVYTAKVFRSLKNVYTVDHVNKSNGAVSNCDVKN